MKKIKNNKAEDRLAVEGFNKSLYTEMLQEKDMDKDELRVTQQIYSFLTTQEFKPSGLEKESLKNRIRISVNKIIRKKQLIRISAAAVIFIIAGVSALLIIQKEKPSGIIEFAQTIEKTEPGTETRLILKGGKEVLIDTKESQITYGQNGQKISIGNEKEIVQEFNSKIQSFNTVIVPYGKRTTVTLSDGTKVWLNSGSKLVYPVVFTEKRREVYVEGEAVFDVEHAANQPFFVNTRDFEIKVLGTLFNVVSYADDITSNTTLAEGKIELRNQNKTSSGRQITAIQPGIMATFNPDNKDFKQQKVNPNEILAWREGYIILRSEKLSDILKRMSRYYNVGIEIKDSKLGNETFSGNLDLKATPQDVLAVIAETTPFSIYFENNKLIINQK